MTTIFELQCKPGYLHKGEKQISMLHFRTHLRKNIKRVKEEEKKEKNQYKCVNLE